jgi:hypothetical protein
MGKYLTAFADFTHRRPSAFPLIPELPARLFMIAAQYSLFKVAPFDTPPDFSILFRPTQYHLYKSIGWLE